MSASGDDGARLSSGLSYIDTSRDYGGFAQTFVYSLGGVVAFGFSAVIAIGEAIANIFVSIADAFGVALPAWVTAFLRRPAEFVGGSFLQAELALGSAPWEQLGPFLPFIAVAVALGVVVLFGEVADRRDWDVPGVDVPGIGFAEGDEGEE
jgi:hypothetical protein